MIASIVWDVSPTIVELGPLKLRWYGLLFASAFYLGYLVLARIYKSEKVPQARLDTLSIYVMVGTVIGARLGHVLFYGPYHTAAGTGYFDDPISILKVWEGGLASHGAAIGIIFSILLYTRRADVRQSFLWVLDRLVIVVALGGVLIRLGNLFNSEIYGHPTSLPWGFIFVRDGLEEPHHPTQLYESLSYLVIFLLLRRTYAQYEGKVPEGRIFGLFLIFLFGVRFLLEFLKQSQMSFEDNMALNMGQLLSIPLVAVGIWLFVRSSK